MNCPPVSQHRQHLHCKVRQLFSVTGKHHFAHSLAVSQKWLHIRIHKAVNARACAVCAYIAHKIINNLLTAAVFAVTVKYRASVSAYILPHLLPGLISQISEQFTLRSRTAHIRKHCKREIDFPLCGLHNRAIALFLFAWKQIQSNTSYRLRANTEKPFLPVDIDAVKYLISSIEWSFSLIGTSAPFLCPTCKVQILSLRLCRLSRFYSAILECLTYKPNTVYNIVFGGHCIKSFMSAYYLNKTCGWRVNYYPTYFSVTDKLFEFCVMLLIGALITLSAGIKIILLNSIPYGIFSPHKPNDAGFTVP